MLWQFRLPQAKCMRVSTFTSLSALFKTSHLYVYIILFGKVSDSVYEDHAILCLAQQ